MTIQCLKGLTRLYHVEEDYDRVFWSTELPADLGGNGSCLDRSAGKVARTGSSRDGAEPAGQSNEGAAGCNEISKTREELLLYLPLEKQHILRGLPKQMKQIISAKTVISEYPS